MTGQNEVRDFTDVPKILRAVKSPLGFLTFSAIICEMVFGAVGAWQGNEKIITFAMHMFLAIVGALVLIAVWCPASLYHPQDIKDINIDPGADKTGKWVVTISLGVSLIAYMAYRLITDCRLQI